MLYTKNNIRREKVRNFDTTRYERFDTVDGIITDCDDDSYRCYVRILETGKDVYFDGYGIKGSKVRLGVKSVNAKTGRTYWMLESVLDYGDYVA